MIFTDSSIVCPQCGEMYSAVGTHSCPTNGTLIMDENCGGLVVSPNYTSHINIGNTFSPGIRLSEETVNEIADKVADIVVDKILDRIVDRILLTEKNEDE